jgi:hypothetical protein
MVLGVGDSVAVMGVCSATSDMLLLGKILGNQVSVKLAALIKSAIALLYKCLCLIIGVADFMYEFCFLGIYNPCRDAKFEPVMRAGNPP